MHISSGLRHSASRNVSYEYTWTHAKESICYNGKILALTEMLAGRGQVKYGAMLEVIRKNEVGLRAVTSSGYIGFLNVMHLNMRRKCMEIMQTASRGYCLESGIKDKLQRGCSFISHIILFCTIFLTTSMVLFLKFGAIK